MRRLLGLLLLLLSLAGCHHCDEFICYEADPVCVGPAFMTAPVEPASSVTAPAPQTGEPPR
jgi:hypothetical protein